MINDAEGESIPIRDYALAYAAQGYKIIPLYTTIPDRPPEQACTCGKMHKDGKSVGKHPYLAHAPHGVNSATSDPAVIATWPEDGYNLGLAMTDTMIAIDIDDSDVAAAMLDPDFGLRDRGIVARTRRGLHFIVPVFVPTTSSVLKHADGRPIGEVRAAGEYIVLPPSRHLTGYYYWIGPGLDQLQAQPPYPGTGYEYAAALLADVGIVPASLSTLTATGLPDGDVIPTVTGDEDLPFKIRQGSILRQMLDGVRPITDRSDALFFMACEFYRQAASKHVVVDPLLVAGIIRRADYAHYHKFSDRNDQDRRYYECAVRAQADVNATQLSLPEAQPMASTDPEQLAVTEQSDIFTDAPVTEHGASDYEYRLGDGLYYLGSKKAERICNFEALITECRVIYHGEETTAGAAPDQEWEITMTKPG